MKKKLMMVAVLLGALSLGACVDDNESASVTDLRGAKAEQLRSIAALYNAQAATEEALRASKVAMQEAQTRQMEALAAKAEAEARIAELEAQLAQDAYDAQLAATLAQYQAALEKANAEIAQSQADMETLAISLQTQLADLQKDLLDAQLELQQKQDAVADQQLRDLNTLASNYSTALTTYTTQSQELAKKEVRLAKQKAELADWENVKAAEISAQELKIELSKKQIEALKQYENYTPDIETLKLQLADAENAYKIADDRYKSLQTAYNNIDINELYDVEKKSELKSAIESNALYKKLHFLQTVTTSDNLGGKDIDGDGVGDCALIDFGPYYPYGTLEWSGILIESAEGDIYSYTAKDSLELELDYKDFADLEAKISIAKNNLGIADLQKDVQNKTTAYNDAMDDLETAQANYDKTPNAANEAALQTANTAVNTARTNKENAEAKLEAAQEQVDEWDAAYALVSDQNIGKELTDAVKAYNDVIVAIHTQKAQAQFAMNAAEDDYSEKLIAYNTLDAMANGPEVNDGFSQTESISVNLYDLIYNGNNVDMTWNDTDEGYLNMWNNWSDGGVDLSNPDVELALQNIWINSYIWHYSNGTTTNVYMGAIDIAEAIEALEASQKEAEEALEELKSAASQEDLIETTQAEYDGLAATVNALKVKVDALKARLDEKMSAYVDEDTPAEEQPAA